MGITETVNPHLITASRILKLTRGEDLLSLDLLRDEVAESMELVLPATAEVVGKTVAQANFPKGLLIGTIVREEEVIIPKGDTLLKAGDHLIITDDAYKRTLDFCKTYLGRYDIECTVVKMCDYEAMEKAIRPNTKVFFSESPTNPYLNIMDLERLMDIFRDRGILVISDSTFATPYNQHPLKYGVDLVIHSATKYLAGHNDILSGVILGDRKLTDPIREFLKITGGVIDPNSSYLLIRGLKTFALRMERLNQSAQEVAEHLEELPGIRRVYYPGLPSHPHHDVAKRQMRGFGSVVTFEVQDDAEYALRFLSNLKILNIGPSLGGVESLITHPATISYYMHTKEEREGLGIKDGLIRLAVGLEDTTDIIADIDQALDKAGPR